MQRIVVSNKVLLLLTNCNINNALAIFARICRVFLQNMIQLRSLKSLKGKGASCFECQTFPVNSSWFNLNCLPNQILDQFANGYFSFYFEFECSIWRNAPFHFLPRHFAVIFTLFYIPTELFLVSSNASVQQLIIFTNCELWKCQSHVNLIPQPISCVYSTSPTPLLNLF